MNKEEGLRRNEWFRKFMGDENSTGETVAWVIASLALISAAFLF